MEYSLGELQSALPRYCPLTCPRLSSGDPAHDDPLDGLDQSNALPKDAKIQDVSHVPVSADQAPRTEGGEEKVDRRCQERAKQSHVN